MQYPWTLQDLILTIPARQVRGLRFQQVRVVGRCIQRNSPRHRPVGQWNDDADGPVKGQQIRRRIHEVRLKSFCDCIGP